MTRLHVRLMVTATPKIAQTAISRLGTLHTANAKPIDRPGIQAFGCVGMWGNDGLQIVGTNIHAAIICQVASLDESYQVVTQAGLGSGAQAIKGFYHHIFCAACDSSGMPALHQPSEPRIPNSRSLRHRTGYGNDVYHL